MRTLKLYNIRNIDHLQQAEETRPLDLDASALNVFTDFKYNMPFVIEADTPAVDTEMLMMKAHVKMKLVVDEKNDFLGIITLQDLSDENIIKSVAQGIDRSEIRVKDLMTPKSGLKAFAFEEIATASVGEVLNSLQKNGLQHCLVVDTETHLIRGLISASDIARKLHIPFSLHRQPSFAEIFRVVSAVHSSKHHPLH